jgi:hypothetical protein
MKRILFLVMVAAVACSPSQATEAPTATTRYPGHAQIQIDACADQFDPAEDTQAYLDCLRRP